MGGIRLPAFETYSIATEIKIMWDRHKSMEQNREPRERTTLIHSNAKVIQGRRNSLFNQ